MKQIYFTENKLMSLIKLKENYNIEYNQNDVDLSSFEKQNELNKDFWDDNDKLNGIVRLRLLKIADDFFNSLEVSFVKPIDIILTGSLCNFNWSNYSDVDLHIVINFSDISEKKNLVQEYFDSKKNEWNESHNDLNFFGYNIELYVEDIDNESVRGGIYSLEKNKWIKKPQYDDLENVSKNKEKKIQKLASIILTKIEMLEDRFNSPYNIYSMEKLQSDVDSLLDKIKNMRKEGLKSYGEMSVGNIIYKICRRTNYLNKLFDLKNKIYDKINSL